MRGRARTGGSVDLDRLEAAIESWEYRISPTSAALATHIDERVPAADVTRPERGDEAHLVVDDAIAVTFVEELGRRFRTTFHVLADRYDAVICYSISAHRDAPSEWRTFTRRHRSESVRFVRRPEPEPEVPGLAGPAAVASVPLVMAAITVVLAGLTGLLSADAGALAVEVGLVLGAISLAAIATAVGLFGLVRRQQLATLS